jgi:hypothetical protein
MTKTSDTTPIASFTEGTPLSTFGAREYKLFQDRIVVCGGRFGQRFETTIRLEDIRAQPGTLFVHGQMFVIGSFLVASMLLFLLAIFLIFGNYDGKFTICYSVGALLAATGIGCCVMSFRKIYMIRFNNNSGVPALDVIAHSKARRQEQYKFGAMIEEQLAKRSTNE